jgi:uncharacterized protein (DUF934 family)
MAVLVRETGFAADDWSGPMLTFEALTGGEPLPEGAGVDMPNDRDPGALAPWLDRLAMVRVAFPAMTDGRGFSLARRLRAMGYQGRLRAAGPLVADQFRAARRVGFDEIELPEALAERQPQDQWRAPAKPWYQAHLAR